jgi:IS30 family transposase
VLVINRRSVRTATKRVKWKVRNRSTVESLLRHSFHFVAVSSLLEENDVDVSVHISFQTYYRFLVLKHVFDLRSSMSALRLRSLFGPCASARPNAQFVCITLSIFSPFSCSESCT